MSNILVVGSIAIDVVFELNSDIKSQIHIENGAVGRQNLMFTAKNRREFKGGTGGNISYGLSILGESPLLFSVAGKDFEGEYAEHLKAKGVDSRVYVEKAGFTATYYGMTDSRGEQIGVWQGNAYGERIEKIGLRSTISAKELAPIKFAIFAPGTPISTLNHMYEFRKENAGACIIFDPGQSLAALYDKAQFESALSLSTFFIGNDIEIEYAKKHFNLNLQKALREGKTVIETKGEKGSVVHNEKTTIEIPAFPPKKIVDVTGAGDAYRAGLLSGLSRGFDFEKAAMLGARMATQCIEHVGGQEYEAPRENL